MAPDWRPGFVRTFEALTLSHVFDFLRVHDGVEVFPPMRFLVPYDFPFSPDNRSFGLVFYYIFCPQSVPDHIPSTVGLTDQVSLT